MTGTPIPQSGQVEGGDSSFENVYIYGNLYYDFAGKDITFNSVNVTGDTTLGDLNVSGYITAPTKRQAAFCARFKTGQANNLTIHDPIVYTDTSGTFRSFDIGNNYDITTGKFTAPIDGVYYFEAQVMSTGWSNGDTTQDLIKLKADPGGFFAYPRQRRSLFNSSVDANGYYTNSVGGMVNIAAGTKVWAQIGRTCSFGNEEYSFFLGHLVA